MQVLLGSAAAQSPSPSGSPSNSPSNSPSYSPSNSPSYSPSNSPSSSPSYSPGGSPSYSPGSSAPAPGPSLGAGGNGSCSFNYSQVSCWPHTFSALLNGPLSRAVAPVHCWATQPTMSVNGSNQCTDGCRTHTSCGFTRAQSTSPACMCTVWPCHCSTPSCCCVAWHAEYHCVAYAEHLHAV